MSDVGYATLPIIPSLKGSRRIIERELNGGVADAGRTAGHSAGEGFNRGFSGVLARLGTVVAAVGIGKAVGAIFSTGIKGAATLETQTTAFASLLGSAAAAKKEIADLQQFAAATPFQQQDVIGYAQQYLALAQSVGLAKGQVIPFLTVVGNLGAVTGATQQDISNAIRAIAQMGSSGKVTLDNLNQVSEAFPGFNGAAAIAAATGMSTAQVMKAISAGSISATVGVQALLAGMQKFPGAAGAMEKQSQTLAGVWSTFTDTLKIKLTQAFLPVIPTIKSALNQLTPVLADTLSKMAPALSALVSNLAPVIGPLVQGIGQVLTSVFGALGPILAALAPVIPPLAAAFGQLVTALTPLAVFAAQIVSQVGPPLLAMFQGLLTALQPLVSVFVASFQPVLPVIAHALAQIGAALAPVVAELASSLAPVLPILAQAFAQVVQAIAPLAGTIGKALVTVIQAIRPQLPELARAAGSLAQAFAQILAAVGPLIPVVAKLVGLALGPWLKLAAKAAEALATVLDDVVGAIKGTIAGLKSLLQTSAASDAFINGVFGKGGSWNKGVAAMNAAKDSADGLTSGMNTAAASIRNVVDAMDSLSQRNIAGDKQQIAAARGSAGTTAPAGLNLPALSSPLELPTPKKKRPKFDVGTLTSFLSANGINQNPLTTALQAIFDSAKAAGKHLSSGVVAILEHDNARLISLTAKRDGIARRLQSARQKLADAIQTYRDERTTIKSAFTSSVNLGTAGTGFDGKQRVTAANILAQVTQAVNRTKRFYGLLTILKKRGLPPALLDQLAQAGVDALPQVQALAAAGTATLAQIKSQYKTLDSTSAKIGKFVADGMYGAGVDSARGLVKGLESQEAALNKAIKKLAKSMVATLKRELGIKSPSRVTRSLGQFTGQGFALGIGDTESHVIAAAKSLSNKGLPASQAAAFGNARGVLPVVSSDQMTRGDLLALIEAIRQMQVVLEVDKEQFATAVDKTRGYSKFNL